MVLIFGLVKIEIILKKKSVEIQYIKIREITD
jgi:hypothetical protein